MISITTFFAITLLGKNIHLFYKAILKLAGVYLHIPFCKQACNYCNFHFTTSLRYKPQLVAAIVKEIELRKDEITTPLETIYFGGGTPSLLTDIELAQIFKALHEHFDTTQVQEITLEANSDDIDEAHLKMWKEAGVNRLSIGVQSFFDDDLKWMNRAHNAQQALQSLQLATQWFDNISVDLIYGLPILTDEKWQQNVQTIIDLGITHVSCYALTVEQKTPLDKLIKLHQRENVDSEKQAHQFLLLMDWLNKAGFEHYEISNFALPGKRSKHNSSYWKGIEYIGIGPAAHSYNGCQRKWNIANNQKYIQSVNDNILPEEIEILTPTQVANERIMIRLRTIEGLDFTEFAADESDSLKQRVKKYQQQGLITIDNDKAVLTQEGKLFADGIAADLFF